MEGRGHFTGERGVVAVLSKSCLDWLPPSLMHAQERRQGLIKTLLKYFSLSSQTETGGSRQLGRCIKFFRLLLNGDSHQKAT